jgi:hypothetical protein
VPEVKLADEELLEVEGVRYVVFSETRMAGDGAYYPQEQAVLSEMSRMTRELQAYRDPKKAEELKTKGLVQRAVDAAMKMVTGEK